MFRVAAMYAVTAWLLLQIGSVTFEPLGLPTWSQRALIIGVAIGLPIALVLAWIFDVTPAGTVRTDGRCLIGPSRSGLSVTFSNAHPIHRVRARNALISASIATRSPDAPAAMRPRSPLGSTSTISSAIAFASVPSAAFTFASLDVITNTGAGT